MYIYLHKKLVCHDRIIDQTREKFIGSDTCFHAEQIFYTLRELYFASCTLACETGTKNAFIDHNGKQALNFQISLLLYSVVIGMISIPFFLGFLPNIFEGGILNLRDFNEFNNINFHFNGDWLRFGRLLWPIGITGMLQLALFVINIVYTILATIRTNEGTGIQVPHHYKIYKVMTILVRHLILLIAMLFSFFMGLSQVSEQSELYRLLKEKDSVLFDAAFNRCDTDTMEALFTEDFEFYHDKGGATIGRESFLAPTVENCANRNPADPQPSKRILQEKQS